NVEKFTGKQLVNNEKEKVPAAPEGTEKVAEGPAPGVGVPSLDVPDVKTPDAKAPTQLPEAPLAQEPAPVAPPKVHTMIIWNGGEMTKAKFRRGRPNEETSTQINREPPVQPRASAPTPPAPSQPAQPPAQPPAKTK